MIKTMIPPPLLSLPEPCGHKMRKSEVFDGGHTYLQVI